MLYLFAILVCLSSDPATEEAKKKVSPETVKKMDEIIAKNDSTACWEFFMSLNKRAPSGDGLIFAYEQYPNLVRCAEDHVKDLFSQGKDIKELMGIFGDWINFCAGNESCTEKGRQWMSARVDEMHSKKSIVDIKKEFHAALRSGDIEGAAEQIAECQKLDGGAECEKLEKVYDAKAEKILQENKKREEAEAAKQARAEAAEKAREEKVAKAGQQKIKAWHTKYQSNALRCAKKTVLDRLHVPDSVRWISTQYLSGAYAAYIFHVVYDSQNPFGVYLRDSLCVFILLEENNPNELSYFYHDDDCPRDRKQAEKKVEERIREWMAQEEPEQKDKQQ